MYTCAMIVSTKGYHWEEVFDAYKTLKEHGWAIHFYTVDGAQVKPDPNSTKKAPILSSIGLGAPKDEAPDSALGKELLLRLDAPKPVETINVDEIDLLYIPGGHGALFDVNTNDNVHAKILEAFEKNKVIASVCHGSSALAFVKNSRGESIIQNKQITGFPDLADELLLKLGMIDASMLPLPYKNEAKIKEAGAQWSSMDTALAIINPTHHVVDLPFITGMGPKAAAPVIKKALEIIQQ